MVVHPGAGHAHGTAGVRPAASLRQPLEHRRSRAAGHRAPAGQGDERLHRGGEDRCGPPVPSEQFANREIKKTYLAVTGIVPRQRKGTINAPIARHRVHRQKMTATEGRGREAVSRLPRAGGGAQPLSHRVKPHTGRTHQIRCI